MKYVTRMWLADQNLSPGPNAGRAKRLKDLVKMRGAKEIGPRSL